MFCNSIHIDNYNGKKGTMWLIECLLYFDIYICFLFNLTLALALWKIHSPPIMGGGSTQNIGGFKRNFKHYDEQLQEPTYSNSSFKLVKLIY